MRYPSISRFLDPDPHTRATLEAELARGPPNPELQALLRRKSPDLWPCFARYYDYLARLPRRVRRGLQRKWKRSLSGVALLLALGQAPALAATITVTGSCTLVDAITAANTDIATGGCRAGRRADVIVLTGDVTLTTVNNTNNNNSYSAQLGANGLPVVTSRIVIEGNDSTITRDLVPDTPEFRILSVGARGNLTLKETTVSGGVAGRVQAIYTCSDGNGGYYECSVEVPTNGGGIANEKGVLTLIGSTVSNNSATGNAGGIANGAGLGNSPDGTLNVTNSSVSGNTARFGGGVYSLGTATLTNSAVSGNTATGNTAGSRGGGLFTNGYYGGTATLTNSTVSGNTAGRSGGGFFATGGYTARGTLNVTNSTVSGNTVSNGDGGGGAFSLVNATLSNITVSGNNAAGSYGRGGGLFIGSNNSSTPTVTLTNSTILGNTAGDQGGAVYNSGILTLARSLISGNTGPNGAEVHNHTDPYGSGSPPVYADNFNLFGHANVTDADAFVGFVPGANDITATSDGTMPTALAAILDTTLASNGGPTKTHALVAGSPAVDEVARRCPPPRTDQRGFRRPVDGDRDHVPKCDIGAFEFRSRKRPK